MVLGFDGGFGGRGGGIVVLLFGFLSYGTLLWRFWICKSMWIFLYCFVTMLLLGHVQICEKWATFVGLRGQFQNQGFG